MALTLYKKKRQFKKTPEPSGNKDRDQADTGERPRLAGKVKPPETDQLRFVVQKHKATTLHYDFRLELDSVLLSWAVPKGPSMDPDVKRLAMMVEDHPLDYMTFEGSIPKGNYGAGTVIVWDIGVYHSSETMNEKENRKRIKAGLMKGHINFVLWGHKLKGLFSLVKIKNDPKGNAWLLIKHKDEYATKHDIASDSRSVLSDTSIADKSLISAKKKAVQNNAKDPVPHDVKPMLTKLARQAFDRDQWIFEIKWDGYRAIAEIKDGQIKLYSRKGNSFIGDYPEIVKALAMIKKDAVLDGEIIALKDGKPDFHSLQNLEETKAPLQYVIFDLLYWDNEDIRGRPLAERKALLKEILPKNDHLVYCDHVEEKGMDFFGIIRKEGFEGMIAKDAQSPYREGVRGDSWLKIKWHNVQEAVIIGYTEPRGSRKKLGALVLGAYDQKRLRYIGHSGGGFIEKELREIHALLSKDKTKIAPVKEKVPVNSPITWIKPKYVAEIKFSEWTPDGRMRHPIYAGLREDKDPKEVVIERMTEGHQEKNSTQESKSENMPTNTDKIFWPNEKYTKGDVIDYYDKISDIILPHIKDRPESLNRHPNGIEGKNFFQKDVANLNLPDFVETTDIWSESNDKEIKYLLCQNKETLLYLANLGCIEVNPWNSRVESLDKPDYMIIDLDPGARPFSDLIEVGIKTHELLIEACEYDCIKTSGKRGLHILVPLGAKYDYETVRIFSELLVRIVHRRMPEITSVERTPSKRKNKIYLDYLQNRRGQTIAAPYSLRPWPGATVSAPLRWEEVKKGLDPAGFTIENIFKRLQKYGDLWEPILIKKVDLEESIKCLQKMGIET